MRCRKKCITFATLDKLEVIEPDQAKRSEYLAAYENWKKTLEKNI